MDRVVAAMKAIALRLDVSRSECGVSKIKISNNNISNSKGYNKRVINGRGFRLDLFLFVVAEFPRLSDHRGFDCDRVQ